MATISEQLERIHPDIIQNYFNSGNASGIPPAIIEYIDKIDKVPELFRRHSSPTRAANELKKLYPHLFASTNTARAIVYAAINHFHLNSTVKNHAWDNLYADRFDELANLEASHGNIEAAKRIYTEAHRLRTLRNDDAIDTDKLRPIIQVISPQVTPEMLQLDGDYSLNTLWGDVKGFIKYQVKNVDDEQKQAILREAATNLNIEDADFEDDSK